MTLVSSVSSPVEKWKTRKDLPALIKLDIRYDIDKLRSDVREIEHREWNACIVGEFEDMRKAFGNRLSAYAYGKEDIDINKDYDWKSLPYKQLALTAFNPDFEIRKDRSGNNMWDKTIMKGNKKFDERAYNRRLDVPDYMANVIDSFGPRVTRVQLAKCDPGAGVKPHRDYDPSFSCRFHIAIDTNEQATFNDIHIPADGYVWFVNTGVTHWVDNNGNEPRTHLIINMDSQELLDESLYLEQY